MQSTAHNLYSNRVSMQHARVTGIESDGFLLDDGQYRFRAHKAFSCLIMPEVGDIVLVSMDSFGETHILHILQRSAEDRSVMEMPKNAVIRASESLGIESPIVEVAAAKAEVHVRETNFVGTIMKTTLEGLKTVVKQTELFAERCMLRTRWSHRVVEKVDDTQAGMSRTLVDGLMAVQTENAVITGKQSVKVDANQIHLG